jgi:putative FmdB family regulatory protein
MIYEHLCLKCVFTFDVVKAAADYDREEPCPKCGNSTRRQFTAGRIHLHHTKVQEAEYNPGLGCIVKNRQHREEICRVRGLEEIGNEKVESVNKHFDRAREDKWERGWREADKGWVGDGT